MNRSLVFSLMVLSAAVRVEAQQAAHETSSNSQMGRPSGATDKGTRAGSAKLYKTTVGILHGKLKRLTDKEIVIENPSNQVLSIRRSHKTVFLRDAEPIHPSDIDLDTPIIVEVSQDNRSLVALNVSVDPSAARMNDHCPER